MPSEIFGKKIVIECLEHYLEEAKKPESKFGLVAVAMVEHDAEDGKKNAKMDCVGELNLQKASLNALDFLKDRIQNCINSWSAPERDPELPGQYYCYNMANGPLGFDFLSWLVSMEMFRTEQKYAGPMKVGFWIGRTPEETMKLMNREMWLNNVFRPALKFVGAEEDPIAKYGTFIQSYTTINIVNMFKNGVKIPELKSSKEYDLPKDCVTITLREAEYDVIRNSKLDDWIRFAKECGERVIFVRDTRLADEPIEGFETCPLASKDLDARLWLYNNSKANLFVSNGPSYLGLFGTKPFLIFIQEDDSVGSVNTKQFWHEQMGIELGEQFPWCRSDQRIVWEHDTHENISRAYDQYIKGNNT